MTAIATLSTIYLFFLKEPIVAETNALRERTASVVVPVMPEPSS
jgi:hypothetical protein